MARTPIASTPQYFKNTPVFILDVGKLYKTRRYVADIDDYLVVKCTEITSVYCVFEILQSYKSNTIYNNVEVGRQYITCLHGRRGGEIPHIFDIAEELTIN